MRPSHIADDHTASNALPKSNIGQDDNNGNNVDNDDHALPKSWQFWSQWGVGGWLW